MKKYGILLVATLLSMGCNSQENKTTAKTEEKNEVVSETPKGSWKVNREFDEAGNLIRFDSVYSWSSGSNLKGLSTFERDSTIKSMQSKFYTHFSQFDFEKEGFPGFFDDDSIFTKQFFTDDFFESEFGKDFMDIDHMHKRMEAMQKQFMERYKPLVKEKGEDKDRQN